MVFFSSSISPRTSADTFLLRSPSATAPMTRCISLVGRTRSSIRLLTDSTLPDQLWVHPPSTTRCESLPCLPTTWLTRANSAPSAWLAMITSLRPSATLPATPVHSSGMRAEKSPPLTWARTLRRTLASTVPSRATGESDIEPPDSPLCHRTSVPQDQIGTPTSKLNPSFVWGGSSRPRSSATPGNGGPGSVRDPSRRARARRPDG